MFTFENVPILVTGAGGFIGSTLVERLVSAGGRVRAFVRYNARSDPGMLAFLPVETLRHVEIIAGDLCDASAVEDAVHGMQMVFHLGALISIPYSYRHPEEVARVNFLGTLNVLQACRIARVERLIHTSTSEVYGTARQVPIDENHPLQSQSPYAAAKIGADKLVESFYCAYSLPAVTVRPFNTYGPRQTARAVIPTIISQALTADVLHLGNLETRRDFTYVDDTVEGFLCAAAAQGVEGQVFNLGAGFDISIGELADKILKIVGRPLAIETDPARLRPEKSEVMRLLSNNAHARALLGWQPRMTFEDGLARTITWIREHLDRYAPGVYRF